MALLINWGLFKTRILNIPLAWRVLLISLASNSKKLKALGISSKRLKTKASHYLQVIIDQRIIGEKLRCQLSQ